MIRALAFALLGSALPATTGCALLGKKETPTAASASPTPAPAATPKPDKPKKNLLQTISFGLLGHRKQEPPKALAATQVGTIKLVDEANQFVLIDTLVYQAASPGDILQAISEGKETATLKVSTLRNPPFLIADIVEGSPGRADRVYKPGSGSH